MHTLALLRVSHSLIFFEFDHAFLYEDEEVCSLQKEEGASQPGLVGCRELQCSAGIRCHTNPSSNQIGDERAWEPRSNLDSHDCGEQGSFPAQSSTSA